MRSIAMAVVMTIAVSTGVMVPVVTIESMTIRVVAIPSMKVSSRAMRTVTSISLIRMMLLMRDIRVGLVIVKLPLAVLFLPDVVIQGDGLIKQRLVVGCIGHGQWYLQLSLESIEEFLLPLSIRVNILRSIPG